MNLNSLFTHSFFITFDAGQRLLPNISPRVTGYSVLSNTSIISSPEAYIFLSEMCALVLMVKPKYSVSIYF